MPKGEPQRSWTTDVFVVFGILFSLGMIGISAVLNFRMGYRMADTELDGWIYGTGAALGDGLKALIPFAMWWAWKQRQLFAVTAGAVLFAVLTTYSLTAGLGFAAQHRAFREAERIGAIERRANLNAELNRAVTQLADLGPQRSEAEVSRAVEAAFAEMAVKSNRTVAEVSKRCTLNRWQTRKACAGIAVLMQELARAKAWASLEARARLARTELDRLGDSGASVEADPQVATLQSLTRAIYRDVPAENVRLGLVLVTGLLFELGSGLGLYVVTIPWRGRGGANRMLEDATRLAAIEDYALDRIVPREGVEMADTDLFVDYVRWCIGRNEVPLTQELFIEQFDGLAREAGIGRRHQSGRVLFANVGLASEG